MKKISIITGVYNEAEIVKDVYKVIKNVFDGLSKNYEYEHIFMDNCSTDNTVNILKEIASQDKRVKILSYSNNFGPIKSGMMAYYYVTGDAVIAFLGNLKDPPELIPIFIEYWEKGYDVVYGIRNKTHENFLLSFLKKAFYGIVNKLSQGKLPLYAGDFRLVDRKVVNELIKLDDYKPYIRGLIASIGFKQIGVKYTGGARPKGKGKSKSSITYLVDFAINAIISYSIAPIRLSTYIGLSLTGLSFFMILTYIILKLTFWKVQVPAISGLIVLFLFFSGMQFIFMGLIGEYIGAIHSQVRKKPFVIIKEKVNIDS